MSNNTIRINKSHIATLRKKPTDSSFCIEYVKIDKPILESTDPLYELLKQEDIRDDKLITLLKGSLNELKSKESLNFCVDVSDSYQGICLKRETIDSIENLENTISGFRKKLIIRKVSEFLKNKKAEKTFNKSLKKVRDSNPIMYSHRYYGWHCEPYNIDSNFKVRIESNFGYGYVSYFLTILTFKEIDIIPYSYFVEYKNANVHEIIRCSKEHSLFDENWEECFNYIIEATSDYRRSPELFIKKYIIDQCEILIEGLDWIATKSRFTFKEDKVTRDKKDSSLIKFETELITRSYKGRLLKFKRAEKITGALSFINSINKCKELFDISSIVQRIEALNNKIEPMLHKEEMMIIREIKAASIEYETLEKKLDKTIIRIGPKIEEYRTLIFNNQKLEIVNFLNKYPSIEKTEIYYNNLKKSVFTAKGYKQQLKKEKEQIEGFIENQKVYFMNQCEC